MKISARNIIKGNIRSITRDGLKAEVVLDIGGRRKIVSHVSTRSVDDLELVEGKPAYALININNVMISIQ